MKKFLVGLFLSLFLATPPAGSLNLKPFLAVFVGTDGNRTYYSVDWKRFNPDLYIESTKWDALEPFLEVVKKQAGERKIIFDLECHGNDSNGLLSTSGDLASVGYVMNRISRVLGNKDIEVCGEFCYAQLCWQRTLKPFLVIDSSNLHVERLKEPISFPVYGVGRSLNYNNLIFLQYYWKIKPYFVDLRNYTGTSISPADSSKTTDIELRSLLGLLRQFN